MKLSFERLLSDEELRAHLERGDTLIFKGLPKAWQELDRQVERLGFGDDYAVSRISKWTTAGEEAITRVTPVRGSCGT